MAEEASWTLDELVRRVAVGLADPAYPGAPNGRVRQLPDRRAVRWYTTTGLVDRPVMQGRTALYSPRHLLQLVAVKRRQAAGPLARRNPGRIGRSHRRTPCVRSPPSLTK